MGSIGEVFLERGILELGIIGSVEFLQLLQIGRSTLGSAVQAPRGVGVSLCWLEHREHRSQALGAEAGRDFGTRL